MSVQYILNPTYSYVENDKLNQELEVTTSLKAPIHYVEDLTISKTVGGNMSLGAPVVEATQLEAPIAVLDTINTEELIPKSGAGGDITVDGNLDFGVGTTSGIKNISYLQVEGATPVPGYVLSALDSFGTLGWVPDATGSTPNIEQVLTVGGNAGQQNLLNVNNFNCSLAVLGNELGGQFGRLSLLDNAGQLVGVFSGEYGGYFTIDNVSSNPTKDLSFSADNSGGKSIKLMSNTEVGGYLKVNNIRDQLDNLGTAGQVLKKSSDNSGIEWQDDALGAPTLSDVLSNGNDANNQSITNVNTITASKVSIISPDEGQVGEFTIANTTGLVSLNKPFESSDYIQSTAGLSAYDNSGWIFEADVATNAITSSKDTNISGFGNISSQTLTASGLASVDSLAVKQSNINPDIYQLRTTQNRFQNRMNSEFFGNKLYLDTIGDYTNILEKGSLTTQEVILRTGLLGESARLQVRDPSSNNVVDIDAAQNQMVSQTSASMSGFGVISSAQLNPTYKAERTLWVSPNNANASPSGSYENPYTTIQAAITYAESQYANTYWYINVLAGTYAGFTVTKKVFVRGMAPSNPDGCSVGCQITSDITVAIDANDGDMFNNQFSLSGFLVAGAKIVDTSTARHVLNITDCYLYNDSGTGRLIDCRPSSTDCRLQVFNSKVINVSASAGDPMVELSVGMARFYQTQFQCAGVQNVVKFSGTSRVDSIVLCSFTSTNASAVLPPIIEVTSSTLSAFTFGNCSFVYTSNTNKSANPSSCAIYGNAAATPTILTVLYSTFSLAGTTDPQNHIINYNAVPSTTFYYSNGAVPNTCHRINGNKTSLTAVV